jgi:hypothetical protein
MTQIALACLKTVPIDTTAASDTIDSVKQYIQFQSTISYLKNPPKGYVDEAVDLMGGLDDIKSKVGNGAYSNEYDFEADISTLVTKAHDGHLAFDGMTSGGVFRWRRSAKIALISASLDGKETPKIYVFSDYNSTGGGFTPSAISKISGKDALQFLEEESATTTYHDPDTRYNAMFYMQPAESWGYFLNPRFYPGASVDITYENGTEQTYTNQAVILDYKNWASVSDGETFYQTFISPTGASKLKKRSPHSLPRHMEHVKEPGLSRRDVPALYPVPAVEHKAADVGLAGFFIPTSVGTIGVLMVQTFNTDDSDGNDDAREFQEVIEKYITEAKSRGVKQHVIDVRTNGGGKILLGYDMYLQFFPSQEPQLMSRYRGGSATDLIGEKISSLNFTSVTGNIYTSPFNFNSYLNKDLEAYTDWTDMYGPAKFNDDEFTNLLRYNLSDPLTTTSDKYSIGITPTGYGDRSNFKDDPFNASDIVIFTDGICASTCSLFTELMVQQSGVKTIAVGGRANTGPMQAVGGTKGSLVLQAEYFQSVASYMIQTFAETKSDVDDWTALLPTPFSINAHAASVNFQDNIRKGLESDGIPTQFLNDSASCRIWYEPQMYLNVTQTWSKVAEVAFGKDGGLDEDACVSGSVATKEEQKGQGEGNPTPSNPTPSSGGNDNGANGGTPSSSSTPGAAASLGRPSSGWTAIVACGTIVLGSMLFGASIV